MKTREEIAQTLVVIDMELAQAEADPPMMIILMQTSECLRWVLEQTDGRKGTLMQRLLDKIAKARAGKESVN